MHFVNMGKFHEEQAMRSVRPTIQAAPPSPSPIPLFSAQLPARATTTVAATQTTNRSRVDNSYITRMVNLSTLVPEIVAAILDDALPNNITLLELAVNLPLLWDEQLKRVFGEQEKDSVLLP